MKFPILKPALVLVALAGCAKPAALHIESSASAIRSAEEHGAPTFPQASLHLQLAKEELAEATKLNEAGDDEEAKSLLLRAEADAELAVALSRAETEKAEAQAAMARVRALQSQNPYAPGGAK